MRDLDEAARLELEISERAVAYALESIAFATSRAWAIAEADPAAAPLMASMVARHAQRCQELITPASPET